MAALKCKMCGGELAFEEGATVCECEYCGSKQTIPNVDDEKKMNLFNRANRLRLANEFDKASGVFESTAAEFPEEAEAYWGLCLCKYGIEYVDDPATAKKVPTCHRTSYDGIFEEENFQMALEYADSVAHKVYREEAKEIDRLQKAILEVASKEEPFDVFICYKETGEDGQRTKDSVLAQDMYDALTGKGYKVFFSRITLEDKLGMEYEPYIFAALNSAKVMLALGTKYEHFNAIWVKNEWARFLELMKKNKEKVLIPCYCDIDAYDMPPEFKNLQGQDMGKIGFMQDLVRGVEKIIPLAKASVTEGVPPTVTTNTATVDSLLKRAYIFLNDRNWRSAEEYCEKVLDMDPENAQAYLGELMAALRVAEKSELANCRLPFDTHKNYEKVLRYGDAALVSELRGYIKHINTRNKEELQSKVYNEALKLMQTANSEDGYKAAAGAFADILDYKDSADLQQKCCEKAEASRKDKIYTEALSLEGKNTITDYESACEKFEKISGWKDADELLSKYRVMIEELKAKEEVELLEKERQAELERVETEKHDKQKRKIVIITVLIICVAVAFASIYGSFIRPNGKYNDAVNLMDSEQYEEAISVFATIKEYKDSLDKIKECKYLSAVKHMDSSKYIVAYEYFIELENYKDSAKLAKSIYTKYKQEELRAAKQGDSVILGTYEQDYNFDNGHEPIEWVVLEKMDGKILVISKYGLEYEELDGEAFNKGYYTWKTCDLRTWLNNDFFEGTFSEQEKKLVSTVKISGGENPYYDSDPGDSTKDKIFLLSIREAEKYFPNDMSRIVQLTEYMEKFLGKYISSPQYGWWLRSPGAYDYYGTYVQPDGVIDSYGDYADSRGMLRPAMWIDLDS